MESRRGYFKTREDRPTPFGKVFLSTFNKDGKIEFYIVSLHRSSDQRTKWHFDAERAAMALIRRLEAGDETALAKANESPDDCLAEAKQIVEAPGKPFGGTVRLSLLAAMEKLEARSGNAVRLGYRNSIVKMLSAHNVIPRDTPKFLDWFEKVADVLSTHKIREQALSATTIEGRFSVLRLILNKLPEYTYAFGETYAQNVNSINHRLRTKVRKASKDARKSHFKPLTLKEITDLLEEAPTLALKLRILAQMSGGFRAGAETDRVRYHHIINGRLQLREIVSKVENVERAPIVALALRLILRLGYTLNENDRLWLLNRCPVQLRRLRTTTASHLMTSRVDYMQIVERLGHADLAMMTRHYCKFRPADFNDNMTVESYYGTRVLRIDGVEVAKNESLFDKFILVQLLNVLNKDAKQREQIEDFRFAKKILLEEAPREQEIVILDSVAEF